MTYFICWSKLNKLLLHVLCDTHDGRLIATSVTIVGAWPHRDDFTIKQFVITLYKYDAILSMIAIPPSQAGELVPGNQCCYRKRTKHEWEQGRCHLYLFDRLDAKRESGTSRTYTPLQRWFYDVVLRETSKFTDLPSGSDHNRSQMGPSCGTSWHRSIIFIYIAV